MSSLRGATRVGPGCTAPDLSNVHGWERGSQGHAGCGEVLQGHSTSPELPGVCTCLSGRASWSHALSILPVHAEERGVE